MAAGLRLGERMVGDSEADNDDEEERGGEVGRADNEVAEEESVGGGTNGGSRARRWEMARSGLSESTVNPAAITE